jgi:membrane-bound serine protease (ClpP class)
MKQFFLKQNIVKSLFVIFLLSCAMKSVAQKSYYEIKIFKEIGATSWTYLKNGLKEAQEKQVDAVFLHLNTYGGQVDFADSMRTAILNYSKPVYVFIDNNAASAGALISIACDSIYMRQGANIGAATVVNENGEKMPDKYQSYMRSIIRSTAEAHGKVTVVENGDTLQKWFRDPKIAEAMVDEFIYIPGIIDSTKILTFTASEAIEHGYCEGIYENIDAIIQGALHESDYEISSYSPTLGDDLKGWLLNPVLHGILIMLIIGGIYFEMQTPGVGFALVVSIVAAILYFAPLYIDGLATAWEGVMIVVGVILILLEVFVIPGFGIAGIAGIILLISGLILTLIPNDFFTFEKVSGEQLYIALATVLLSLIGSTILIVYLSSKIGVDGVFKNLALNKSIDDEYVGVSKKENSLVGKEGITETVLCPSGKVVIEGESYNAVSESGYLNEGVKVIVKKYATGQIYVKEVK